MDRNPWWLFANFTTWIAVTIHAAWGVWPW